MRSKAWVAAGGGGQNGDGDSSSGAISEAVEVGSGEAGAESCGGRGVDSAKDPLHLVLRLDRRGAVATARNAAARRRERLGAALVEVGLALC